MTLLPSSPTTIRGRGWRDPGSGVTTLKANYPYTRRYRTQHGREVFYYRRNGRNRRLQGLPGSAEFQREYDAASAELADGQPQPSTGVTRPAVNTLRWLAVEYFHSVEFGQLADSTQSARRGVLESMLVELLVRGEADTIFADCPLRSLSPKHVRVLRDRKAGTPEAANIRVKALRTLFKWAIERDIGGLTNNPARDVPKLKVEGEGYHSWTPKERELFELQHPVGTKARLAYALILFTGQRRSDVVLLGRQHVRDGRLCFTQTKNKRRKPVALELRILPELQAVLDASPVGELTYLVNDYSKPFAVAGFGNKFREWCDEAGLPKHCSAHGLRKAAATVAAENGATAHELMAIFGWLSLKEAERYTRAAERKKLSDRGMGRLIPLKPSGA